MTRTTLGRELEPEHALLADAHRVEAAAVELEHLTRTLVHDHVATDLLGNVLAEPLRADRRARLLVAGDDHQQLAPRGPPARSRKLARGRDLACDLALHVERAASPHEAVANSPDHGSTVHSPAFASTVSTWPR